MALRANALTTVAACKSQLDIPTGNTDYDSYLERLINVASQQIERYCNRSFVSAEYTEIFDGNGASQLLLPNSPVTAIGEINADSSRVFDTATVIDSSEYSFNSIGVVQKISGTWGTSRQSVRIEYTAGFTVIPADLEESCILLVEIRFRMKNDRRLGRESQSKAGEDITYIDGWPKEITDVLDGYKIIPMVDGSSAYLR